MKYINIFLFIIFLFFNCTNDRNYRRIGVLYTEQNSYYDKELKNSILDWKFNNNYYVNIYKLTGDNIKEIKNDIIEKKIGAVIAEVNNGNIIANLFKFCHRNNIVFNLIATSTNYKFNKLFITDFKSLGRQIGNNLYVLSRSRRNKVVIYFEKNYRNSYLKNTLLTGFIKFNKEKNIILSTNVYTGNINSNQIKSNLKKWISIYSNNFRGIFTDSEKIAIILLNLIRRAGKDGEIKIAAYGATLDGINSMLKIGLSVTADENRISLFTNALSYNKDNKFIAHEKKIIYIPGIIYNQTILLENLSKSKKYSIKQLVSEYKYKQ